MEWLSQLLQNMPQRLHALSELSFSISGVTFNPFIVIKSLIIVAILMWLCSFVVRLTDKRLRRVAEMRTSTRTLILKIQQIILYCFVFICGMQLLGINLGALSVFGGALGVGIGFGLQKIASNFISGIILLFEKSIESGDIIELNDGTLGTVKRTYARYTLLELQDGREVLIPNEEFISQRVVSFTHSYKEARAQLTLKVAFDSDFDVVKKLMLEAADNHPKRVKKRPSLCYLNQFTDFGVEMILYFWIVDVTEGRAGPRSDVMQSILAAFEAHNIVIPYPQVSMMDLLPRATPASTPGLGTSKPAPTKR